MKKKKVSNCSEYTVGTMQSECTLCLCCFSFVVDVVVVVVVFNVGVFLLLVLCFLFSIANSYIFSFICMKFEKKSAIHLFLIGH